MHIGNSVNPEHYGTVLVWYTNRAMQRSNSPYMVIKCNNSLPAGDAISTINLETPLREVTRSGLSVGGTLSIVPVDREQPVKVCLE